MKRINIHFLQIIYTKKNNKNKNINYVVMNLI